VITVEAPGHLCLFVLSHQGLVSKKLGKTHRAFFLESCFIRSLRRDGHAYTSTLSTLDRLNQHPTWFKQEQPTPKNLSRLTVGGLCRSANQEEHLPALRVMNEARKPEETSSKNARSFFVS